MANIINIQKVIRQLEHFKRTNKFYKFQLSHWLYEDYKCGTVGCIGGWAEFIMENERESDSYISESEIASWLGIDYDLSAELFYAYSLPNKVNQIDSLPYQQRLDAGIYVLRGIIKTNQVDWKRAIELAETKPIKIKPIKGKVARKVKE